MKQLSSNRTLIFKTFIPIFWLVFFGAFTVSTFFMKESYIGQISIEFFRILTIVFYLAGSATLALTTMRLKRIELGESEIFVSNYIKSYKYRLDDLEKIRIQNYGLFKSMKVIFKGQTSFGTKISAITSERKLKKVLETYPQHSELMEY